MKKVTIVFIAALFLATSLGSACLAGAVPTEKGVIWKLVNPMGGFEVTQLHASRLNDLAGKTICEVSIDVWQAHRVLPAIREALQGKFPTVKIVPFTEFPQGTAEIDNDKTAQLLKDKGCQAAIVGNAG
jgi:hypothetical protein